MLGSTMLEVAIGMAFIYTLLSLVCSMLREAVEACVKSRASDLELGIRNLLGSPDAAIGGINFVLRGLWPRKLVSTTTNAGNATSALLYKHPLVKSLYAGAYGPSYLPTQTFVAALFDIRSTLRCGLPIGAPASIDANRLTGAWL